HGRLAPEHDSAVEVRLPVEVEPVHVFELGASDVGLLPTGVEEAADVGLEVVGETDVAPAEGVPDAVDGCDGKGVGVEVEGGVEGELVELRFVVAGAPGAVDGRNVDDLEVGI